MADEFTTRTDPYRRELLAYCYRMLGSAHDAEDLVQETLLRAWRARDSYDPGRASLRTWLYRIATNVCLTALEQRARRPLPAGLGGPPGDDPHEPLVHGGEVPWLQPIPDAMIGDPAEVAAARGSLRLALVAAMQQLPARQRAVLVLREALDWPPGQIAEALEMTTAAVNSALQRARKTLSANGISEDDVTEPTDQRAVLDRYVNAFLDADLTALEKLLADDVIMEMPPFLNWYLGREHYIFFMARVYATNGTDWRVLPVAANGQLGFAAYVRAPSGGYAMHTLQIFTIAGGVITRNTVTQDPDVYDLFGLAAVLPE
ncbi:sigma-70 family RNA polymerase sigma factor [Nocardia acidivorans]|uniref:sigma-70 family RNA polymerase sigma factor n=1 Tax=Nocardia acidivorans TaxID=404580 RepID=UPI00083031B0|nr:sigma-70 family RNA polymerase sigma factor [Nocardia acidivorans]